MGVLENIDSISPSRRYRTLYLLSKMYPVISTTRTPRCLLLFRYISLIYLWTIFRQQFLNENHSIDSAFLTDLFTRTNKDLKFCPIWAPCRHSVIILQALNHSGTQDTWTLKPLKVLKTLKAVIHLRHLGTWVLKALVGLMHLFPQTPLYSVHKHC